jgi:Na+/proline symporter
MSLSIDTILFCSFLSLNLIIGLWAGTKVKSMREYAIGSKDFSTGTLTSTIVATWISGGFMFYALQNIYSKGLQFIIVTMGGTISLLVTGQVLAKRMGEFLDNLSIAEAMRDLYGKAAQIITVISGVICGLGWIAIQFKVVGKMIGFLLGIADGPWLTVAAAVIVTFYSAFGGVRSVTITDIFQFITFSICVPILALIIWNQLEDPSRVAEILEHSPLFSWEVAIGWNLTTLSMLGIMLNYAIPGIAPSIFQRIVMAKDVYQARDSFTYAAWIRLLIVISVAWMAILLLADPTVKDPANLVAHIITQYAYPGLKALIAIGITSMAMSTADSELNATAILVTNDAIKPLIGEPKRPLLTVKIISILVGLGAIVLGLYMQNLLNIALFANSFYMPIVTVPFLLAVLGFRSKPTPALIGMAAGLITVILWSIYGSNADSVIPGMLANLIFLIASHYLLKAEGGWIGVKVTAPLIAARKRSRARWEAFIQSLKPQAIYHSLQNSLPGREAIYALVGLYVIGATYTSFFTVTSGIVAAQEDLYHFLAHSTLILTAIFITYPAWPPTFKKQWFMTFFWPLGIGYLFFVVGSILVLLSGYHQVQVMIFMLNIIIVSLLLPWRTMGLLCLAGMILGRFLFYSQGGGIELVEPIASLQFKIFYSVLLFSGSLIAIILFRESRKALERKHAYLQEAKVETDQRLMRALEYEERFFKALDTEGMEVLKKLAKEGTLLATQLKEVPKERLTTEIQHSVTHFGHQAQVTSQYLDTVVHRASYYLRLESGRFSMEQLLKEVIDKIELQSPPPTPTIDISYRSSVPTIECDGHLIKKLLTNSILYAKHATAADSLPIHVEILDTMLGYPMNSIQGHIKKVPALRIIISTAPVLPQPEELYISNMGDGSLAVTGDKKGALLLANKQILEAHYGYLALELTPATTTQVYVIPQQLREVRPKEMDSIEMDPLHPLSASNESYKGAAEQEANFLASLHLVDKEELYMVHKAIRFIKKYHGPVKRKSGEPFYLHPIAVAQIVAGYTNDVNTILGALLHDIVEDTAITLSQIELMFNATVRQIVDGVTHLDSSAKTIYKVKLATNENIMQLLTAEDKRVLYVKLADRLHNMQTIQFHSSVAKQKEIAEETLSFFVPTAKYLKLDAVATELKQLCLAVFNR